MSKKNVDDYITEGIYGTRLPKEKERVRFLGTFRERIVIALTIGQVMTDSGIKRLEESMQENPNAKLVINGHVSYRFLTAEKALADKYNIPYTLITNELNETDIGAVLKYDYAIDKEDIFIKDEPEPVKEEVVEKSEKENNTLLSKIKQWFS